MSKIQVGMVVDPSIFQSRQVELYRENGLWGSRLCPGSTTSIAIWADVDKFIDTLVMT